MKKILVTDDEIEIVRLLDEFLSSKGYFVSTATDGLEAIRKVKIQRPDAVLLDLIMPGLEGIEVLKEIKKLSPRTPVIVISAVIHENIIRSAREAGADKYFFKPFDLDVIEQNLSDFITVYEQMSEGDLLC